jgi:hypothetical protein
LLRPNAKQRHVNNLPHKNNLRQCAGEIQHELVDVTPAPIFPRLKGLHDGMPESVKMFGSVFVLRGITAADMAAGHTQTEMHPIVPHIQALLTALGSTRLDGLNLIDM